MISFVFVLVLLFDCVRVCYSNVMEVSVDATAKVNTMQRGIS